MLAPEILLDTGTSRLWIVRNYCLDLYENIRALPMYEEPPIMVHGKWGKQRRNIGFFSNDSKGYQYSTTFIPSQPLSTSPVLEWLLPEVNRSLGTNFNGMLVNRYVDGTKKLGAHSDEESALDKTKRMVAGIAFGPGAAQRPFRIRDKRSGNIVLDVTWEPCTLLVMEGEFQSSFTHEIPERLRVKDERVSVTFRHHLE